tara:strand:+ start:78 stop:326 length:249 start_codon:yes stop_codon:yes gene_type:complete
MKVLKRYIAKIEKTLYTLETIEIVAESENDAEDKMRDGDGKVLATEIQEETVNSRWIDSSEPLDVVDYIELEQFNEENLPIG